nr:FecR family protein [uncultured Allomuricauda sp.]
MKPTTLIIKRLTTKLTLQEEKALEEWLRESDKNQELFDTIKSLKENGTSISNLVFWDSEKAWANVLQKYEMGRVRKTRKKSVSSFLKYAAVFAGIFVLGYSYFEYSFTKQTSSIDPDAVILTLENGEIQLLSEDNEHEITSKDGSVLGVKSGIRLNYTTAKPPKKLTYNTLTVPYGKRFEVILSDSTLVYLNAGSSLKYPIQFIEGSERKVFLDGEAFFNVTHAKKNKFIVSTSEMDVTVYGTKFNVSAYAEDKYINTVLVEGSVGLSSSETGQIKDTQKLRLEPGYKAEWNTETGNTVFDRVDTDLYTSWINGRLVMKNFTFKSITSRLERRYNVQIINNYEELDNEVFTASFDIETIEEVLASFAENKDFEFESLNNKITINKPSKQ